MEKRGFVAVPGGEDAKQDAEAKGASTEDQENQAGLPPKRLVLLVVVSIVQGYTLIGPLQHFFKSALNIEDTGVLGHVFTQAVALVQWGKFAMTLGQNVVFNTLQPIVRVYIAMGLMTAGTFVPPFFVYLIGSSWLGWVFVSYGLIGLSLGIFECTFLNVITPLGPLTKSWAIMGFPAAFFIINVFGMTLVSFGLPVSAIFWYVFLGVPLGSALFVWQFAPGLADSPVPGAEQGKSKTDVWSSLLDWRTWLPALCPFMLANIVGHYVMEGAIPASFNTFNDGFVAVLGPMDTHLMNTSRFFVVFFMLVGLGDTLSRRTGYCFNLDTYGSYALALGSGLLCSVVGMYLFTLGIAWVSWAAAFLTFWGQGFNYAISAKYIDRFVPAAHNLAAYSFWMFAGSAGAIAGSTTVDIIRSWVCGEHTFPHQCINHHG